ncbi:MAG: spermidine/putrescine ABC transporter substrate-binding protein [Actinomycetota bacterium]
MPPRHDRARTRIDRRTFLHASLAATAGIATAGLVAGCRKTAASGPAGPTTGVLLDPGRPSVWPIDERAAPIPGGLTPERGATLRVYQWRDYLYDDVLESFARRHARYGVDVHVESFTTMEEAIARLRRPGASFDVFFPTIDALPDLVLSGMLRPLNHAYLPNVANLWPWFRGSSRPFYDAGQRFTVPYTVYSSGIAYNRDLVRDVDAPPTAGFDLLWNERYAGATAFYDQYREAIALSLLRDGLDDPMRASDVEIERAASSLVDAVGGLDARLATDAAYRDVPAGRLAAAQAWSGDVVSAVRHGRGGPRAADRLGYWWPMTGGVVGIDLTAVLIQGRNPVLAHAFLDHLLDERVAIENYSWNGYQPPVAALDRASLSSPGSPWTGMLPDHLLHCGVLTQRELEQGRFLVRPAPSADGTWLRAWQRVVAAT